MLLTKYMTDYAVPPFLSNDELVIVGKSSNTPDRVFVQVVNRPGKVTGWLDEDSLIPVR